MNHFPCLLNPERRSDIILRQMIIGYRDLITIPDIMNNATT